MLKKWFSTFYKNISSCVINNGYTTGFFRLYRGVRQGWPLSGLLFALALEPLAHSIRKNDKIKGLWLGDKEIKLSLYAHDTTTFLRDEASAHELFNLLEEFSACSGLKINKSKCEGLRLGSEKNNVKSASFDINWPEHYVIALGIAFSCCKDCEKLNFYDKLNKLLLSIYLTTFNW